MNKKMFFLIGALTAVVGLLTFTLSSGLAAQGTNRTALYYTVTIIGLSDDFESKAINNAGEVGGIYDDPIGEYRAFYWANGSMTNLGTIGGYYSEGYGISPTGQVVGCAVDDDDITLVPVRWNGTTAIELDPEGCAVDANSSGTTVGWLSVEHQYGFSGNPVKWEGSQAIPLPMASGDLSGDAVAINDGGEIVGWSREWFPPARLRGSIGTTGS